MIKINRKGRAMKKLVIVSICLFLFGAVGDTQAFPIQKLEGLQSITFYEMTSGSKVFTLDAYGEELMAQLEKPLATNNTDFMGVIGREFYDVFYCNAEGDFNANGRYLAVEATYNSIRGGALNLAEVYLNFDDPSIEYDSYIRGYVALGNSANPESAELATDDDLGTWSRLGDTVGTDEHLQVIIGFDVARHPVPTTISHGPYVYDGDFGNWEFSSVATATAFVEESNGNPDARINITTVSTIHGVSAAGLAINLDYSTKRHLAHNEFVVGLDVLSGPGAHRDGQRIFLLVKQNGDIYRTNLGVTGYPCYWDTFTWTGSLVDTTFDHIVGDGPEFPDFTGGVETFFGFSAWNHISGVLTQYYDNFTLELHPAQSQRNKKSKK